MAALSTNDNDATCYLRKLKGHQRPVTCLANSVINDHILASGSEDKTIRIWDTRLGKSIKSMQHVFSNPIESICFDEQENGGSGTGASEWLLYCTEGSKLFVFDLRSEMILLTAPIHIRDDIASDDINSIRCYGNNALSETRHMIAISDDSGQVSILNPLTMETPICRITEAHSSIASAIALRRKSGMMTEVISGGFDCKICAWDIGTSTLKYVVNLSDPSTLLGRAGSTQQQQFLNPAFVHCLDCICNDELIVCGAGDGSLRAIRAEDGRVLANELEAHNGMVTSIHGCGNVVASAGVDKIVRLWEFRTQNLDDIIASLDLGVGSSGAKTSSKKKSNPAKPKKKGGAAGTSSAAASVPSVDSTSIESATIHSRWSVEHIDKVNVVLGSRRATGLEMLSMPIYVADVSNEISIYESQR